MSSTWTDLKAVQLALNFFAVSLSGKVVRWHTDKQNCVKIVRKGSTELSNSLIQLEAQNYFIHQFNSFKQCSFEHFPQVY